MDINAMTSYCFLIADSFFQSIQDCHAFFPLEHYQVALVRELGYFLSEVSQMLLSSRIAKHLD